MGRIDQDYATDSTVTGADKVIGTDAADSSTKNYTIDGIKGYVENNLDFGSLDASNFVYNVYDNLVMNATTDSTTTVLNYGVNVVTTSTSSDLACKLPQPVTGKKVTIVNKSGMSIKLFPSNTGGQINNYPIDAPAIIPNNGSAYDFVCVENPLPGEWVWSAPANAQYDFGNMSIDLDSASGYTFGVAVGFAGTGYTIESGTGVRTYDLTNGVNQAYNYTSLVSGDAFAQFKPSFLINSITKIKVYTNVVDQTGTGYNNPLVNINMATAFDYYDQTTGDYITNGGEDGSNQIFYFTLDKVVSGTASGTYFSSNIGDPGTMYGERVFNYDANNYGYVPTDALGNPQSKLGDDLPVSVQYPFNDGTAYVGQQVDKIYTGLLYPYIYPFGPSKPSYGSDTFKFKVIIEYN